MPGESAPGEWSHDEPDPAAWTGGDETDEPCPHPGYEFTGEERTPERPEDW